MSPARQASASFNEGGKADRFRIIETGTVALRADGRQLCAADH